MNWYLFKDHRVCKKIKAAGVHKYYISEINNHNQRNDYKHQNLLNVYQLLRRKYMSLKSTP